MNKGFTLVELLIAIALFSIISLAAYKLFQSVNQAREASVEILEELDEMQRTMILLEKDTLQMLSRPIRNEFGDKEPAVQSPGIQGELVVFTRSGWRNPLNATRSTLQRVTYSLEQGQLIRYFWLKLDRAPKGKVFRQVLLNQVNDMQWRFLNNKKQWVDTWPPAPKYTENNEENRKSIMTDHTFTIMPQAIEITLDHAIYGIQQIISPLVTFKSSDNEDYVPKKDKRRSSFFERRDYEDN
ncbi:Type II secretion system protein J [invertebrate metagenome]|uniref:Type II secretion system protein J n=1 Tax=invertebrate metagenome TaxID=1711999 RepID=A0A2H9T5Y3_9ZZZZ